MKITITIAKAGETIIATEQEVPRGFDLELLDLWTMEKTFNTWAPEYRLHVNLVESPTDVPVPAKE